MNISITGLGRSGTTALADRIGRTFPELLQIDEPKADPGRKANVIIKANPIYTEKFWKSYQSFDKKVMIVRDPRDWCVSELLFRAAGSWHHEEQLVHTFVKHLRQKERDPKTRSVTQLYRDLRFSYSPDGAPDYLAGLLDLAINFYNKHSEYYLVYYEDLVAGCLGELETYLGRTLHPRTDVHDRHQNVVRKKEAGDWKNWFLEEDVEVFRPRFLDFMEAFGYEDDWTLARWPEIKPEHSSEYVLKLVNDVRFARGLPMLRKEAPNG